MEVSRLRAGRPLRSNVVGTYGSPTNAPWPAATDGFADRCGGNSASLKCGREPKVPPTNAPRLKCGARVRWMAWLVRPHFSTGGFAPYVAEGFAAVALKPSCSPPQRNGGRCHPACRLCGFGGGKTAKKGTPVNPGCFCFPGSAVGNPLAWGLCWGKGALA